MDNSESDNAPPSRGRRSEACEGRTFTNKNHHSPSNRRTYARKNFDDFQSKNVNEPPGYRRHSDHRYPDRNTSESRRGNMHQPRNFSRPRNSHRGHRVARSRMDHERYTEHHQQRTPIEINFVNDNVTTDENLACNTSIDEDVKEIIVSTSTLNPSAAEFIPGGFCKPSRSESSEISAHTSVPKLVHNQDENKNDTEPMNDVNEKSTEEDKVVDSNKYIRQRHGQKRHDRRRRDNHDQRHTRKEFRTRKGKTDTIEKSPRVEKEATWEQSFNETDSSQDSSFQHEHGSSETICSNTSGRLQDGKYRRTKFVPLNMSMHKRDEVSTCPDYRAFIEKIGSIRKEPCTIVYEIDCDLFDVSEDHALAHCVGSDFAMSAGIAIKFHKQFGRVDELLAQQQSEGGLAWLNVDGRYIYYLVTKTSSRGKPTYESLFKSLRKLQVQMAAHDVKLLAIPRIGCGLDRLGWQKVKPMIEYIFNQDTVKVVVCNLQMGERSPSKSPLPNRRSFPKDDKA